MDRRNYNVLCFDDIVSWLNDYATPSKLDILLENNQTLSPYKIPTALTPEKLRRSATSSFRDSSLNPTGTKSS